MDIHILISILLFAAFFLVAISCIEKLTAHFDFPYTVALLLVGLVSQLLVAAAGADLNFLKLDPELIFYILLPTLLFEASMHINIHQFRRQFKTISFLASFGLLLSMFVVGVGLSVLLGLPFGVALLFGALISATDPIAVLALFKTLGAPKRLALLADGESMFNDATGVIAFRLVAGFVLTGSTVRAGSIAEGAIDFIYVFFGSMIVGALLGYTTSRILALFRHDRILANALTVALALGSFVVAEHVLHLSGVITTVMAGIAIGNLGRNKVPEQARHFIEEFWSFLGFVALSVVFFFASFGLQLDIFASNLWQTAIAIVLVLAARAVSVYASAWITNHAPIFRDEPGIPMPWQHILNWGGLRGVIPLVLVYSLPDSFPYKEDFLGFTLGTLVFTLIFNGMTIRWLLTRLNLHVPSADEMIIRQEMQIFDIEQQKQRLSDLIQREFDKGILKAVRQELDLREAQLRNELLQMTKPEEFLHSLKVQALHIERETLEKLYAQGRFDEDVYYYFESELDLQTDALEYPGIYQDDAITPEGFLDTSRSFRKRLIGWRRALEDLPGAARLFERQQNHWIEERFQLLRARLFTSYAVMDYLDQVEGIFTKPAYRQSINQVRLIQQKYINHNLAEIDRISKNSPEIVQSYQERMINLLIEKPLAIAPR